MSIFGVQFSSGNSACLEQKTCQPGQLPAPQICRTKSIILDKCCKKENCCEKNCKTPCNNRCCEKKCKNCCDNDCHHNDHSPCSTENIDCNAPRVKSTQTAIVNGKRVLRPWVDKCCDPCRPPSPPPLPLCCDEKKPCHVKKSKIIETRVSDCGSVIVNLLVNGGPKQKLAMFVDLPQCDFPCDEIAFNVRSVTIGEGKCLQHCEVPCDFVVFEIDGKKGTPSGVHIQITFVCNFAPKALLEKEGPCCCFVPFCIEFELWRRKKEPCCTEVETVAMPSSENSSCGDCGDNCGDQE